MSDLQYPFKSFIDALKAKDEALFHKIGALPPSQFWREWKKVYPEDFPQDGVSAADASSITPRTKPFHSLSRNEDAIAVRPEDEK